MKKIICIALSLVMMLGALMTVSAAEINVDMNSADVAAFAEYLGEDFDENYFCIINFSNNKLSEIQASGGYSALMEMNITAENSNDELCIDAYYFKSDTKKFEKITLVNMSGEAVSNIVGNGKAINTIVDTDKNLWDSDSTSRVCLVLTNPEALDSDAAINVELKGYALSSTGLSADGIVFDTVLHEFKAPVTFTDEALSDFGTLLTKLKFDKNIVADDIAAALDDAAASAKLDDTISTLKTALKENNVDIGELAKTLQKGNLTINKTAVCDNLTVEMPYIALADGVGTEEKVYAPSVENIVKSAKDGKATMSLELGIKVNDAPLAHKPIIAQKVRVQLPAEFDKSKSITVNHEGSTIDGTIVNGYAEFVTDSFSTFTIEGTAVTYDETTSTHATQALLKITQDDADSNVFTISLAPSNGQIIKYATGEYKITIIEADHSNTEEAAMTNFVYELEAANGITITNETVIEPNAALKEMKVFSFVASASDRENLITAEPKSPDDLTSSTGLLPLAKLTIKGTGDFTVTTSGVKNDNDDISEKFYMETFDDNDSKKAGIKGDTEYATIKEKKFDIKLNVNFNLNLQEEDTGNYANNAEYIDIAIELKNEISGDVHTVKIGKGTNTDDVTYLPVTYNPESSNASGVVTLPANATYTYKISGLGFRTFRGSVYLNDDKEITLWNNALTAPQNVVKGDNTTANAVTFIVGDVYEDGIVDIYDLSAVTAYFGAKDIDRANENVYACDLDRDGQISVQDLAWAMYSFGY